MGWVTSWLPVQATPHHTETSCTSCFQPNDGGVLGVAAIFTFFTEGKRKVVFLLVFCAVIRIFAPVPRWWCAARMSDGWDDILKKAFAKRFDFDCVRISQVQRIVKLEATADVPWDEYIIMYISFSVGRLCCSFRLSGQCESLYTVERVTSIGSTFFLCVSWT